MSERIEHNLPILPGGTVTFLFTDIEDSTQLLDQLRDQYADLLTGHHHIIRVALEQWHGHEVDTQGDAFFAAFPKATEAVAAVAQILRELAEYSWPEGVQVRVRMGLHTGEPWLVEEGYVGMDVHRAARIGHVGYGGQVLLSETTTALVRNELPEGVRLLDLGRHRLKGMRRPESIQQLVIEGLPSEFPPLNSLEALPAVQVGPPGDGKSRASRQVGPSPYRGLAAFQESDTELFFGREAFTEQLALAVGERQLVAVIIGPSGAGKSSAVFAGLLPKLREEGRWLIVEMRPGAEPFQALAGALLPVLENDLSKTDQLIETQKLAKAMRDGELSLFQVAELALSQRDDADRLLLVIDQFEEIFTLRPDAEDQHLFLDELLAAAEAGAGRRRAPLVLLLTLRADFMGQALGHRPFTDAVQEGALILGPMNQEELRTAIEKPAELAGAAFEPGLVQRILDDIGEEPGNLPLLEFALTLLWERLEEGWMTHAAYEEIGRVDGALARYAEEVWEDLDESERARARPLFVQLVQPGEGTEDTRRVARRSELAANHWALVQHLADRRLVVTGRDEAGDETVEVVHEALIRVWERLRTWMIDDRAFRTWQEGLRVALRGWESRDRDEGSLLRAAPLALALEWAEENQTELSANESEYIETSRQYTEKRAAEEEARRQRELETARKLAETEKARADEQSRASTQLRWLAAGLAIIFLVALAAALVAVDRSQKAQTSANAEATSAAIANDEAEQRATAQTFAEEESQRADEERDAAIEAQATAQAEADFRATAEADAINKQEEAERQQGLAEEQAALAQSREMALQALNILEGDPELSILLAVEANSTARTTEAANALHQAVTTSRVRMRLITNGDVADVEMSSTGEYIAAADIDNSIAFVWDAFTGHELLQAPTLRFGTSDFGFARVDFNLDGTQLATLNPEDTVSIAIWELPSGDEHSTIKLPLPTDNLTDYALSPDWSQFAVGYIDGSVSVWEIETGRQLYDLSAHTDWVRLSYSQNGQRLATVSRDNTAWVWEAATGEALFNVSVNHIEWLSHGEFLSPDGTLLAYSAGPEIHIWNLEDESLTPTTTPTTVLKGQGYSFGISFSPDGRRIATSSRNQTVWIWDPLTGEEIIKLNHGLSNAWAVAFSPDDTQLITSDWQGNVRTWDITPLGEEELRTYAIDGIVWDISPDGEKLLTGTAGQNLLGLGSTATVWDIMSGEALFVLEGHTADISRPLFSPDGELLATASQDGTAIIWDANTGKPLQVLDGHDDGFVGGGNFLGVLAIAFNHDGSLVATAGTDKTARIWDVATGEELQVLTGHTMGLTNVAFSPDGRLLATASEESDAFVRIWDVGTGTELFSLPPSHADKVWGLAFSSNERILATGGGDATVKVWYLDLEAGEGHLLATLIGFSSGTWFTSFSPDGRALAASDGTLLKVWDISSLINFDSDRLGETVNIPEMLSTPAGWAFAFNPVNGSLFFGLNGTVRAYTLSTDELMDIAAVRVTRSLTDDECKQYLHLEACPSD